MERGAEETRKPGLGLVSELNLYYLLVALYFLAFGMQFVLFPSLVAFNLDATPAGVGLAQSALSAPMFCLLLFGGLLAERARPSTTIALLYLGFAFTTLILCAVVAAGQLTYSFLITYAVIVGSCAAFAMPVRDAALNGIVAREAELGKHTPIATAAAVTTAVQIGAQIAGILIAQFAGRSPAPYLAIQALALALGAAVALTMQAPKPSGHERTLQGALRDLKEGLVYSFRDPVMSPMLISAAYVGVFVIGAFQVLFPLIIRDAYGGDNHTQGCGSVRCSPASGVRHSYPLCWPLKPLPAWPFAYASHLIGAAALPGFHKPFLLFAFIVVRWGFAAGIAISTSRTIVQGAAGQRYLGRVLAVYSMGFMGGAPVGSALVGFAAGEFGPRAAAFAPAIGLALASLALAIFTPLWRYTPAQASATELPETETG
jgi:MFS family permease